MKVIKTEDAVGHVLCHDITQIIKGVTKDARFRKGHVVTEEDIPVLLSIGKDNLYVWEKDDTMYHENEAAEILRDVCINDHMLPSQVKEGKIELTAACDGLFQVDVERLYKINEIDQVMTTRHTNSPVKEGDKLLGARIIPLVIQKEKMEQVKERAGDTPLCRLLPYRALKAGIITTGNEVFYGRIQDTFTPVVVAKLEKYGVEVCKHVTLGDDKGQITKAILDMKEQGCDLILTTGGMSVDPDESDAGGDQRQRRRGSFLWSAGTAGSNVLSGVFCRWNDGDGIAGLCDVCEGNDF